jgi:hypothetical protein
LPGIEDWVDEGPGGLDTIGAIEESSVPTHAVVQKRSISAAFAFPKSGTIAEIHGYVRQAHLLPG